MKTLLITLSIVGLGILAWWYFFSSGPELTHETPTNVELPVAPQNINQSPVSVVELAQKQTLILPTTDGGYVAVLNFLANADTVSDPLIEGYYNVGGFTTIKEPFMIIYITATKYFNIELLQEPIGHSRELAEQYLKQRLGISTSEMCRLNYSIGAPSSVSGLYGGAELGFSFCPGATVLPK